MPWPTPPTEKQLVNLKAALDRLYTVFDADPSRPEFQEGFEFPLAVKSGDDVQGQRVGMWSDRSFCPLLLKSLANSTRFQPRTPKLDRKIERLWAVLADRRSGRAAPLWDKFSNGFSVYYTERVVEALVKLTKYAEQPILDDAGDEERLAHLSIQLDLREVAGLLSTIAPPPAVGSSPLQGAAPSSGASGLVDELRRECRKWISADAFGGETVKVTSELEEIGAREKAGLPPQMVLVSILGVLLTYMGHFDTSAVSTEATKPRKRPTARPKT